MWPFRRKGPGETSDAESSPLGPRGEKLARKLLKKQGMKILARNYRCPVGEADLIALDPSTRRKTGAETIAFVEVKTRRSDRYSDPESAVDPKKRRRMRKVAEYYLTAHDIGERAVRFDVVSVVLPTDGRCEIRHIPDAF